MAQDILANQDTCAPEAIEWAKNKLMIFEAGAVSHTHEITDQPWEPGTGNGNGRSKGRQERGATTNQLAAIHKMLPIKLWNDAEIAVVVHKLENSESITFDEASKAVGLLIKSPWKPREAKPAAVKHSGPKVTQPGMYRSGDDVFQVMWGNEEKTYLFAKIWDSETERFRFRQGAGDLYKLDPAGLMSFEDAAQFSREISRCCVCSKRLTKQSSIDAGIGPICAGKMSWA